MQIEQKKWTAGKGWENLSENGIKDKAQLVFLFGERNLLKDELRINEVKGNYPLAHLIGCSTAGEIINTEVNDDSLAVTAVYFEDTPLQFAQTELKEMEESYKAGKELAESLNKEGLVHVFVLSDGLNINGSELAKGFMSTLPDHVALTGGLAGDQSRFQETLVFSNSLPNTKTVVAIGFYGTRLKVGYGSFGGWDSFGPDRLVTRSKGSVLYELDGKPALELYKQYLGDQAQGLPATGLLFPLSLRLQGKDEGLVRTILAVNEEENSLTFAGDVPEGSYARLMKANYERLIYGASQAGQMAIMENKPSQPDLAILISCVGRKLVLKQKVEEEVESVQAIFGKQTALTGFYSYGEICPIAPTENQCELHNQTMTITTFSE